VKNCIGIADFLCAYADGELPEANRQMVEDHLEICENCSAILKVYRDISITIDESNVTAPDALLLGVMNRIQSESTPRATAKKKLISQNRARLLRYMPIAAGLVVMVLVWQFWGDAFVMRNFAANDAAQAPAAMQSIPAPQAAPAPATMEVFAEAEHDDAEEAIDGLQQRTGDIGGAAEPAAPAGGAAPTAPAATTDMSSPEGGSRDPEETEQIMAYMSGASAEITIAGGELPAFLANIEPQPFGSWFGWEMVFEIPDSEVQALLEALINRAGVGVVRNHNDSSYAVVLFTPG